MTNYFIVSISEIFQMYNLVRKQWWISSLIVAHTISLAMASSALESTAAFAERAKAIGVEQWIIQKFQEKHMDTYGRFAFAITYSPQHPNDKPLSDFVESVVDREVSADQMATLRRLFFEAHTLALADVRSRVETGADPTVPSRKLPTAERVARQKAQESRLGGLIFNPDTIPSNNLVDMFVDMVETGVLSYVKAEQCCSRAQEVSLMKRDPTIATDSSGLLKVSSKQKEPTCEANTELKLRSAFQRRSLAMDLSGISTFDVIEGWVQFLFSHLMKEQPRGYSKVSLQQIVDCDKQLFVMASHMTMGRLSASPGEKKPLDEVITTLKSSSEILQYLAPLQTLKSTEPPTKGDKPPKIQKTEHINDKGKGGAKGKVSIPDDCATHDADGKPLCFKYQSGKCSFKGPAGKRCAKGYHKCYKKGCFRLKPYYQCNHAD